MRNEYGRVGFEIFQFLGKQAGAEMLGLQSQRAILIAECGLDNQIAQRRYAIDQFPELRIYTGISSEYQTTASAPQFITDRWNHMLSRKHMHFPTIQINHLTQCYGLVSQRRGLRIRQDREIRPDFPIENMLFQCGDCL